MATSEKSNIDNHLRWTKIIGNYTLAELQSLGIPPEGGLTAGISPLAFLDQSQYENSELPIRITNTGNEGLTIQCTPSAFFTSSADALIAAGQYHDFTITAPNGGTPSTDYNETLFFQAVEDPSITITIPVTITILSTAVTFTVTDGDANQTVEIPEYYDYATSGSSEQINNVHSDLISVDVLFFGSNVMASPDPITNIPSLGSSNTNFQDTYTKITNAIGVTQSIQFKDTVSIPQYILNGWSVNYTIKGLCRMTTDAADLNGIVITANRVKVNSGSWINLPAGTVDFHFGDVITWEVTIDEDPPNTFNETLQMEVYNRSGGAPFKTDTVVVPFSGTATTTIVFTAISASTLGYNEGSIDLKLFE